MNKVRRFIKEYKRYKVAQLEKLEDKELMGEKVREIEKTVWCLEKGYITIDECMKQLVEI